MILTRCHGRPGRIGCRLGHRGLGPWRSPPAIKLAESIRDLKSGQGCEGEQQGSNEYGRRHTEHEPSPPGRAFGQLVSRGSLCPQAGCLSQKALSAGSHRLRRRGFGVLQHLNFQGRPQQRLQLGCILRVTSQASLNALFLLQAGKALVQNALKVSLHFAFSLSMMRCRAARARCCSDSTAPLVLPRTCPTSALLKPSTNLSMITCC